MPNLRGASRVGRGEGGRSYAAQTVSRDKPRARCREESTSISVWRGMTNAVELIGDNGCEVIDNGREVFDSARADRV